MEILPQYLANVFAFLRSVSTIKFFLLLFALLLVTNLAAASAGGQVALAINAITFFLLPILFAGYLACHIYTKPKASVTHPFWVMMNSKPWFNRLYEIFSRANRCFKLFSIHALCLLSLISTGLVVRTVIMG